MSTVSLLAAMAPASLAHASQAPAAPALAINAVSQPTNVSPTEGGHISVLVSNQGGAPTSEPIAISDTVSANLHVTSASLLEVPGENEAVECPVSASTVTCPPFEGALAPENTQGLSLVIAVEPVQLQLEEFASNDAEATGGGSVTAKAHNQLKISSSRPAFGLSDFHFAVLDGGGDEDTQAGDHPDAVTVDADFNTVPSPLGGEKLEASELPRSLSLELPIGLIGNPRSAPTCPQYDLTITPICPANTVIGTVAFRSVFPGVTLSQAGEADVTPLFNMQAEHGYPAEFAFEYEGRPSEIYASVVHRAGGYAMRMSIPAITPAAELTGVQLTFFGDPANVDETGAAPAALFTTPFDCRQSAEALQATASVTSWTQPAGSQPPEPQSVSLPAPSGCSQLRFAPQLEVRPETAQADSPDGLTVHLAMPQDESATDLGTPPLKDATVTLPAGMSLSLPSGNGLRGCATSGPEGINLDEDSPGPDGQLQPAPGKCPRASRIGAARIVTPLLAAPLQGSVYLAAPACAPCDEEQVEEGKLIGVYVEAEGSGINLKLPGKVEVGGATLTSHDGEPPLAPGQLRLQLQTNPQLPTAEVELELNGGALALLENPVGCGRATSTSQILGWGTEGNAATPESFFTTGWSESGEACPATTPFAPSFSAGTAAALAGAASPFTMTFARHDREQALSSIAMQTPPGLAAEMAGVPRCPEPQASLGECPAASAVGHVHVALGPGTQPLWVEGPVYLTGPYGGAPFGLSLVIPAKAGPFDLGNVVVRASIAVDPRTAALTIDAGPLPSSAAAVPLRIQTVSMTLDRPGFTLDPTDCSQQQVSATIASAAGVDAAASTPFAVADCANLPFKAQLSAHSEAQTSRNGGAMLHLKISSAGGQANVAKLRVVLPKQMPTRLSALQHACPGRLFNANPATCPASSLVGEGIVHTKMLSSPLVGPAYFVSHGGVAFPDLELVLQSEGVVVILDANTIIRNGITTSTFHALPDMQLQTLSLMLPEGPHSLLGANGSLCAKPLSLSTALVGQNGAKEASTTTHLAVAGCQPAGKKRKRAKS